jgi:hypothetical protein
MRPFFIRNYDPVKANLDDQFNELLNEKFKDGGEKELEEKLETVKRSVSVY